MSKSSLNRVLLIGNLGADADVRTTAAGGTIASLSVATSESWKDKESGETKERTEWHRVKCFGKLGEIMAELAKKGRQVFVEGQIRTEKYTDKEGVERTSFEIVADEVKLLGPAPAADKPSDDSAANDGNGNGQRGYGNRAANG